MSSSSLEPPLHLKQLKQLLQEKQEPFALENYVSQRHPKKNNSDTVYNYCHRDNSTKSSKRTRKFDSFNILKLVTNKLISYRSNCSKFSTSKCEDQTKQKVSIVPPKRSTLREVKADRTKCQCGYTENVKNLIPISAEASPAHKNKKYVLITIEEESKTVLRQKNQLLYECAKIAIDTQETKRKSNRGTVGPKERRKTIHSQFGNVKNIAQLINLDLCNEIGQWNNFQQLNTEIRIEIGDSILDDIISELI